MPCFFICYNCFGPLFHLSSYSLKAPISLALSEIELLTFDDNSFTEETQPGLMDCKDAAKKLIDLGLVFTPINETIKDAVASLEAKGFLALGKRQ